MASSSVIKAIGLDIGTTTISSVFTSGKDLTVEESATIPNNSFLPKRAEWESLQDPLLITETVRTQLDKILSRHPDTQVIGLTGQMQCAVSRFYAVGTPAAKKYALLLTSGSPNVYEAIEAQYKGILKFFRSEDLGVFEYDGRKAGTEEALAEVKAFGASL